MYIYSYKDLEINSVNPIADFVPHENFLLNNYPNPFNPGTKISYSIPESDYVSLKVYNLLGKEVQTLVDEFQIANTYSVMFNAGDLSSGIYFYKLQLGNHMVKTKKMIILR